MKYRKMGSLGWEVSALGFGAMRLPTKRRFLVRTVDEKRAIRIIRQAIDLGVNYVDTAWPYHLGASERIVGQALQDGYREKVHLATKLPTFMVLRPDDYDRILNQQLGRLQLDGVDIYLFHSMNAMQLEKIKRLNLIAKMEEARAQNKIKYIGFSFHDNLSVFKEVVDYYDWDLVQIQYNYMDTGIQATTEGLEYAHSKGISVVIMEPVKGGQLVNPPPEARAIMDRATTKRTPVDWALQFVWNRPEVSVVLSGMSDEKMVDENCASAGRSGIGSLSAEDEAILSEVAAIYRQKILVPCTACGYCMPCPAGVNIPRNFALLNECSGSSQRVFRWMSKLGYLGLANSKRRLNKENPNGNAAMCIKCGKCLEKCPQQIDIPTELEKVHAIMGRHRPIDELYPQ
jgi:predicted aldo/keto reductase-like oxidoreductase